MRAAARALADFDEVWDKSLAEMRALDPKIELKPYPLKASFAECFDLYFTGVGGARIHAKYLRPKNDPGPHPAWSCSTATGGTAAAGRINWGMSRRATPSPRWTCAGRAGYLRRCRRHDRANGQRPLYPGH